MPEAKSPLKLKLFEALTDAFPDGEVSVKDYPPGHSKLAARRLVHAHIGVRVVCVSNQDGKAIPYAIAGMIPATAEQKDIEELLARLADDKRRVEITMKPGQAF